MAAQPQQELPRMTVEEYLAFEVAHPEGKYEYIDGYVRDLRALSPCYPVANMLR